MERQFTAAVTARARTKESWGLTDAATAPRSSSRSWKMLVLRPAYAPDHRPGVRNPHQLVHSSPRSTPAIMASRRRAASPDCFPSGARTNKAVTASSFITARFAFAKAERLSSGQARLTICGLARDAYSVERSGDLIQWTAAGVVTNTSGFIDLADAGSLGNRQMFYRARLR